MLPAAPSPDPDPDAAASAVPPAPPPVLRGMGHLVVLERGWLSSNNTLLLPGDRDEPARLVDSGHVLHAAQTVALVRRALDGRPLAETVNTHLHSDHCGGNAALQRAFGCRLRTPPGDHAAARAWDEDALSYRATGQRCERFVPDGVLAPGERLAVGRHDWEVLAAPGHDPHSVMLFDERSGVLLSADALWENGFGVVFPELDGVDAFDDVAAALDAIAARPVRAVVPGHGAPFADVCAALSRARARLEGFRRDPARHARHAAKVLVKYHLMEEQRQDWAGLCGWADAAPLTGAVWRRLGRPHGSLHGWLEAIVRELADGGALRVDGGVVHNA